MLKGKGLGMRPPQVNSRHRFVREREFADLRRANDEFVSEFWLKRRCGFFVALAFA